MAVFYRADVVRRAKGGWKVFSEKTGRALSQAYRSKGQAKKRLQQIEYFKHRGDARKLPRPIKNRSRLPRQIPPTRHAAEYQKALLGLIRRLRVAWRPVLQALPGLIEGAALARADAFAVREPRMRKDIDDTQRLKALVAQAAAASERALTQHEVENLARKFADQTQHYQREQITRQVRAALGVDPIFRDKGLAARTEQFTHENVALVRRIPQRLHGELESMVTRAVAGGVRGAPTGPELTAAAKKKSRTLAAQIEDRFKVSEKHARVIARDQIGKFYAGVNHARQKEMGVSRFIWRSVGDERVRGTPGGKYPNAEPSHYDLDGNEYSYDDPPTPPGANEPLLPGEDYQCRCWAEPVFEDFDDDEPEDDEESDD